MFSLRLWLAGMLFFWGISSDAVLGQKKTVDASLYVASGIPDSMKQDANSIVRRSTTDMEVLSSSKAVIKHQRIVTILNQKAEDEITAVMYYDKKFRLLSDPEMLVYDADGKLIKRYKKSDMYDRSAYDGISIVTDDRMLIASHSIASYPVTVEIKYELTLNGFLDLPDWHIQSGETSVLSSSYNVVINPSLGFRFLAKNTTLKPVKSTVDGFDRYSWSVTNLKAIKLEPGAQSWAVLPQISFATDKMEYNGLPGDFSSWKGFGAWQNTLNRDVCDLSAQRAEEIRQSVSSLTTDREKVRFLYEGMQKQMRYVSIQLGIGGLKPFPASYVDSKKYGDCKALTNYMYSVLKAAGIKSHYALINAGENEEPASPSFVNSPFNHVILCVPFEKDSVWLECTNSTAAFGRLGNFTENRYALLVKEDGGELVRTPVSRMEDNVLSTDARITVDPSGISKANIRVTTTGEYRDMFVGLSAKKSDDQKQYLITYFNLRQPDVFLIKEVGDADGRRVTDIELEYSNLSEMRTGNKAFYRPRILDIWKTTLPSNNTRKTDLFLSFPLMGKQESAYVLPSEMEVESLPADVSLKFEYGSFDARYSYHKEDNTVKCTSEIKLNKHIVPAAKYKEMQSFLDDIAKSSSKKLVLHKKI